MLRLAIDWYVQGQKTAGDYSPFLVLSILSALLVFQGRCLLQGIE